MAPPSASCNSRPVDQDPFARIIGRSAAAESIRAFGRRAAAVDAPVLLLGESGTGKGVLARAIHDASPRARKQFVAVNCAAIPESLFESEFFGHVRGAFTGAQYAHKGLFEQADGGTLFLDEIGELPLTAQAKLLTTIEDLCVRRVGAEKHSTVDVRFIAATAADVSARVIAQTFRLDLLHRLSVLSFRVPALRQRSEDILELALHFLQLVSRRYGRSPCPIDSASLSSLMAHDWPGNLRELSNVIEAAVVATTDDMIELCVSLEFAQLYAATRTNAPAKRDEIDLIRTVLRKYNGNRTRAARELGMSRTTLWQKLRANDQLSDSVNE